MFSSQTDSLLRSFSRGPRKADPHSRVYNPPKDDAIIAQFAFTAQGGVKGTFKKIFAPTPPQLGTDPAKPLILLAQTAICPESRPQLPRLRPPGRNPPPRTASRTPARLSAPLRAFSRFSARVVLPLRFSCLFVSRVGELSCPAREAATKVAMRCGARGETQSQAPGRRRASRLRSNPPRRGRRSWPRVAPYVRVMGWTPPGTDPTKPRFFGSFRRRSPLCGFRRWPRGWTREERSRACPRPEGSRV